MIIISGTLSSFESLKLGDLFQFENTIWMRIPDCRTITQKHNCVSMESGGLSYLIAAAKVAKLNGTLTVQPITD